MLLGVNIKSKVSNEVRATGGAENGSELLILVLGFIIYLLIDKAKRSRVRNIAR